MVRGRVVNADTGATVRPGVSSDVGLYGPSRPSSGAAIEVADIKANGTFELRVAPGRNYAYLRPRLPWSLRDPQPARSDPAAWIEVAAGEVREIEFRVVVGAVTKR